jgi:hypothetical protein
VLGGIGSNPGRRALLPKDAEPHIPGIDERKDYAQRPILEFVGYDMQVDTNLTGPRAGDAWGAGEMVRTSVTVRIRLKVLAELSDEVMLRLRAAQQKVSGIRLSEPLCDISGEFILNGGTLRKSPAARWDILLTLLSHNPNEVLWKASEELVAG